MNASELKQKIERVNPESKFFSRENMKFAGDIMSNFGVYACHVETPYDENGEYMNGEKRVVEVWCIYRKAKTRKGFPAGNLAYFDKTTYRQLHCAEQVIR